MPNPVTLSTKSGAWPITGGLPSAKLTGPTRGHIPEPLTGQSGRPGSHKSWGLTQAGDHSQSALGPQTLRSLEQGVETSSTPLLLARSQTLTGLAPSMLQTARQGLKPVSDHQVLNLDAGDQAVSESARSIRLADTGSAFAPERLSQRSTLEVVGHGSPDGSLLGGLTPRQLAQKLATAGITRLAVLDLKSCDSAQFKSALAAELKQVGIEVGELRGYTGQIAISRETGKVLSAQAIQHQGHDGALGFEQALLSEAFEKEHIKPDGKQKALENVRTILNNSKDPFYCLLAVGLLKKHEPDEARAVLDNICAQLHSIDALSLPRKAEFQLEAAKLWEQLGEPDKAMIAQVQAADTATRQGDYKTLLTLGRLFDSPQTRQEAASFLEKGLTLALAQASTASKPELADTLLNNLEYWSKMPGVWAKAQMVLPKVAELIYESAQTARKSKENEHVLDLAEKYILLDAQANTPTPLNYAGLGDFALAKFSAAKTPEKMANIAHAWAQITAKIANSNPDAGVIAAQRSAELLTGLQKRLVSELEQSITKQQGIEKEIQSGNQPPRPDQLQALQKAYGKTEALNEQMIALQNELLASALIKIRHPEPSVRSNGLQQLDDARGVLTGLLNQPDFLAFGNTVPLSSLPVTPICKLKTLESLMQATESAVNAGHFKDIDKQFEQMLKTSQSFKDPDLHHQLDQLVLTCSQRLLSVPETEPETRLTAGKFAQQLLTSRLPRFVEIQSVNSQEVWALNPRVEPEQALELARLLQPIDPEKSGKLSHLIAGKCLELAHSSGFDDPKTTLTAFRQTMEAIRSGGTPNPQQLEALQQGVQTLIEGAAKVQNTELLGQAMHLARMYRSDAELSDALSGPLLDLALSMAKAGKPDSALKTLQLVAEIASDTKTLEKLAGGLQEMAQTGLSLSGYEGLSFAATRSLMSLAFRLKQAGSEDYRQLESPLVSLIEALKPKWPPEQVNVLVQQGLRLFKGVIQQSPILGQTDKGSIQLGFQPSLESDFRRISDASKFNHPDKVSQARIHKETVIAHYASLGHPNPQSHPEEARDLDLKVEKFVEIVARKSQLAYEELKSQNFGGWDIAKGHYKRKCLLKDQWDQIKSAYGLPTTSPVPANQEVHVAAVFYDMQRIVTIGRNGVKSDADQAIQDAWDKAVDEAKKDKSRSAESRFIEARKLVHQDPNAAHTKKAAKEATGMLSTLGGYLIEERTYQLLKASVSDKSQTLPWLGDKVSWTDQDTDILGASTRPDLSLKIPGHNLNLLMDFTAFKSNGHILAKTPSWIKDPNIADSVEVLYPSMTQTELKSFILEGKALSQAEIQRVKEAYAAEKQAIEDRKKAVDGVARFVHNKLISPKYIVKLPMSDDEKENVAHLAKRLNLKQLPNLDVRDFAHREKTNSKRVTDGSDFYIKTARDVLANPGKYGLHLSYKETPDGPEKPNQAIIDYLAPLVKAVAKIDEVAI